MDHGHAVGIDMFNPCFPVGRLMLNERGKELPQDTEIGAVGDF